MSFWQKLKSAFGGDEGSRQAAAPSSEVESPTDRRQRAFEELVLEEASTLDFVERIERHPELPFTLNVWYASGGENEAQLYLGNIFAETVELSPEEKRARVAGFLSALKSRETLPWLEAKAVVVPLIRTVTYGAGLEIVSRPFVPFLRHCLGVDRGQSTEIVSASHLEQWGVNAEDVFTAACSVLETHVAPEDVEVWDEAAPYATFHVARDDSYEASRLLLPGFLASFRGRVAGAPLAIVPHRSSLIIAGDGDERAVSRLLRSAENEFRASTRPISPVLYSVDDADRVVPWQPPPGHPCSAQVAFSRILLAGSEYAEQKETLEKELEEQGIDLFVASLGIIRRKSDDMPFSYAVWPENVATLLPEADLLALNHGEEQGQSRTTLVPWPEVMTIAGQHLSRDPRLEPARWRSGEWPEPETLAKLAAKAIDW